MDNERVFGDWLRNELDARGLTISETARRLGVSQGAVSNWVRDLRRPDADSIRRLAEVLDIPVEQVMNASADEQEHPEQVQPVAPRRRVRPRSSPMQLGMLETVTEAQSSGFKTGFELGIESAFAEMHRVLALLRRIPMDDEAAKHVYPWLDSLIDTFDPSNYHGVNLMKEH